MSHRTSSTTPHDGGGGTTNRRQLLHGWFEARFEQADAAKAAARDARAVRFEVDVRQDASGWWLLACRCRLPFFADDRDRYASRIQAIANHHGGAYSQFVDDAAQPTPAKGRG